MDAGSTLPPGNSPNLVLTHPTPEEKQATWKLNGQAWRGTMDISTYVRREAHLEDQAFTRDGGITFWILVDTTLPPNARSILASCETFRKKALIARENNEVEQITSHGIGSVFCNPEYRGRGYAQRMIKELGMMLEHWQQKNGERTSFTVLYSDIGKQQTFYSRMGWQAFSSSHISLPAKGSPGLSYSARYLRAEDLPEFCKTDEKWLRRELGQVQRSDSKIFVALVPDAKTIQWHHAREEFAGQELLGRFPELKGAWAKTATGDQVWCIWTRTFGSSGAGNTLDILRFVIEGDQIFREGKKHHVDCNYLNKPKIEAAAVVLRAAQLEAYRWNMDRVHVWNPTTMTLLAAQEVEASTQMIDRDQESITSLRWHGLDPQEVGKVEWISNEKYGWC
ncbi:hypothetical protein ACLMJK_003557 [Lecanora helva]